MSFNCDSDYSPCRCLCPFKVPAGPFAKLHHGRTSQKPLGGPVFTVTLAGWRIRRKHKLEHMKAAAGIVRKRARIS